MDSNISSRMSRTVFQILNLALHLPGQSFDNFLDLWISRKRWEMKQTLPLPSDRKSGIWHGTAPLWMLYVMTLTYIFKVTNFEMWIFRKGAELYHRMRPLWMLYQHFQAQAFHRYAFALNKCVGGGQICHDSDGSAVGLVLSFENVTFTPYPKRAKTR